VRVTLSRRGDYAVRTMVALGSEPRGNILSATRIAQRMDIPVRFLAHVLADLGRAGLVIGQEGRNGGYRLAEPAAGISLLQIVDAAEPERAPRCVLRGGPCDAAGRCAVHDAFSAATAALRAELAGSTLEEVAKRQVTSA
jgi:Rrf2 family transcriptional regulator, iron-sulfur cluster assembly transcription factor